ncbi:MAG: glycosyl transferase family 1 [Acidobacteria bacterium]|nr:glycosyl transferase family 1 [Acidobacteriota bacterium]
MPPAIILLTPNLTGHDGISAVARLVTHACDRVAVLALHEPRALRMWDRATVRGAGGGRLRFALSALRSAATAADATVILNHVHLAPAALAFAARGARLVTILHGIEAWTPLTAIQRTALARSARVVAVSAFSRARFFEANPDLRDRAVDVCHHGIAPLAAPDEVHDRGPAALIVGRMQADERYKGHDALIELWPAVMAAVPDAVLRIVGDGDDRARLEAKVRAIGLETRVLFLGRVDDDALQREYAQATVFVMPSPREGFGLVFLEAMRAARACVGCRGAASEIIADGDTGWLVEPDDRVQLTDCIVRTLRDRPAADAMGARGRARFLQQFTEQRFRDRFTALLLVAS